MGEHEHRPRTIERHCDVALNGADESALRTALELRRRGWSVIAVDPDPAGEEVDTLRAHGGEVLAGRITTVDRAGTGFRLSLVGGHSVLARHLLAPGTDLAAVATDLERHSASGAATSANEADWDRRYSGSPLWSGNPNGSLVHEVSEMTPGRALDVGAGEGGDAIWLAQRGWVVTANDISRIALDRVAAAAAERGLAVTCLHADANTVGAFPAASFDLVVAMYASIPRTGDERAVTQLLGAVAPGGTLLAVSHDIAPMRAPIDTDTASRAFDPDAYVRVEDIARRVDGHPDWSIEVHELRPRPKGSATDAHHVDDLVLRVRRRA